MIEEGNQPLTIQQFLKKHPQIKMSSMRWMILKREKNGLSESGCLFKPAGKILIDEHKFFGWLKKKM